MSWITERLPIISAHTPGFRSRLGPCPLSSAPSLASHQPRNPCPVRFLLDDNRLPELKSALSLCLLSPTNDQNPSENWGRPKKPCTEGQLPRRDSCINPGNHRCRRLLVGYRFVLPDAAYNKARKCLKRQLIGSLRNKREQCLLVERKKMEEAPAIGIICNAYWLIRNTGPQNRTYSRWICNPAACRFNPSGIEQSTLGDSLICAL